MQDLYIHTCHRYLLTYFFAPPTTTLVSIPYPPTRYILPLPYLKPDPPPYPNTTSTDYANLVRIHPFRRPQPTNRPYQTNKKPIRPNKQTKQATQTDKPNKQTKTTYQKPPPCQPPEPTASQNSPFSSSPKSPSHTSPALSASLPNNNHNHNNNNNYLPPIIAPLQSATKELLLHRNFCPREENPRLDRRGDNLLGNDNDKNNNRKWC